MSKHTLGCHGHEHLSVRMMGAARFRSDLRQSKAALEDVAGAEVIAFRAPYFSADHCNPWFGEILAECGFSIDSSYRLRSAPPRFAGLMNMPGSVGAVREVPLLALGYGLKRITVIGGTYLRVLPLRVVLTLLDLAKCQGFIPLVYVHPYDIDPHAEPLDLPRIGHALGRLGDRVRHLGRSGGGEKLRALSRVYEFQPVEYFVSLERTLPITGMPRVADDPEQLTTPRAAPERPGPHREHHFD
jgi:peptidoglycan/xylan/chitin deacetylase (PgdA/CDA1 family)